MLSLRRRLSLLFGLWAVGTGGPPAAYLVSGWFTGSASGGEVGVVAGLFVMGVGVAAVGLPTDELAERFRAGTKLGVPMLLAAGTLLAALPISILIGILPAVPFAVGGTFGFLQPFSLAIWPTRPSLTAAAPQATASLSGRRENGRRLAGFWHYDSPAFSQRSVWRCLSGTLVGFC